MQHTVAYIIFNVETSKQHSEKNKYNNGQSMKSNLYIKIRKVTINSMVTSLPYFVLWRLPVANGEIWLGYDWFYLYFHFQQSYVIPPNLLCRIPHFRQIRYLPIHLTPPTRQHSLFLLQTYL